eukprot:m.1633213 g.1633213  ORF g.1633213 m.1633213 type:complete len:948 (-) comp25406_c0_seq26:7750-10593(-)
MVLRKSPSLLLMLKILILATCIGGATGNDVVIGCLLLNNQEVLAAQLAADYINSQAGFWSGSTPNFVRINTTIDTGNGWNALRAGCDMLYSGVNAIIGPGYSRSALLLSPLCENANVPCISHAATSPSLSDKSKYPYFARVVAQDTKQAASMISFAVENSWQKVCILHQDDDYGVQGALETQKAAIEANIQVLSMLQYETTESNLTTILRVAAAAQCRIFFLWCTNCQTAMESAVSLGLGPSIDIAWLLSDGCSFDTFAPRPSLRRKLIGLNCLAPGVPRHGAVFNAFTAAWDADAYGDPSPYTILAFDAILAAAVAIRDSPHPSAASVPFTLNATDRCVSTLHSPHVTWSAGSSVLDALQTSTFQGASSGDATLRFDASLDRLNGRYSINNMQSYGMTSGVFIETANVVVSSNGSVSMETLLNTQWTENFDPRPSAILGIDSRPLRLISVMGEGSNEPFQMADTLNPLCARCYDNPSSINTECPNECYKGVTFDVLRAVALDAGFNFTINHIDASYGYTSVLNDFVLNGDYDMAVGDFTATASRAGIASLSYPYLDLGLNLMVSKSIVRGSSESGLELFSIGQPFSTGLWIAILVYVVIFAAMFWVFEHGKNIAVPDWHGNVYGTAVNKAKTHLRERKHGKNTIATTDDLDAFKQYNRDSGVVNATYWSITALAHSTDLAPITIPGKMLSMTYLIVNLIFVASYTANLAAFLTAQNEDTQIWQGLDDIGTTFPFDSICLPNLGGSYENFWDIKFPNQRCFNCRTGDANWTFSRCLTELKDPSSKVQAIVGDSTINDYVELQECDVQTVGSLFYLQGYSFLTPPNSQFMNVVSQSILAKREDQTLEHIFGTYYGSGICDVISAQDAQDIDTTQITLQDMSGLFVIGASFAVLSLILYIRELQIDKKLDSEKRRLSLELDSSAMKQVSNAAFKVQDHTVERAPFDFEI